MTPIKNQQFPCRHVPARACSIDGKMNEERNHRATWVRDLVVRFCRESSENSLQLNHTEGAFHGPIVGFSSGNDPLYTFFQKDIGSFYWHPSDVISRAYPQVVVQPQNVSVISYVLPQTLQTRSEQRKEKKYPSKRWAHARKYGEQFNNRIRQHLVEKINEEGFPAVAPVLLLDWKRAESTAYGYASTWSERHTAYVSGLGTFGMSDGLITPAGKAIRVGSVIALMDLPPTKRTYSTPMEFCLHQHSGKCLKCAQRCPVGAITAKGHDKIKCKQYIRQITAPWLEKNIGIRVNACGLCQTGVPCESIVPIPEKRRQLAAQRGND